MIEVVTRAICEEVNWTRRGISFTFYGDESSFIIGQHVLFEGVDKVVVECRFTRMAFGGFVRWNVEVE